MKPLAISVLAFRDDQEAAVLPLLTRHGIRGLETAPSRVNAASAYRLHWQQHGITLCAMQSLLYGAPPCALFETDALRQQMLDNVQAACALAQQLGIRHLVFGSNGQRRRGNIPYETAFSLAVPFFKRAADIAARYNTCLCLEAVPVEHGCDFIISTLEAADLVHAVNHPAFALHFDVGSCALALEDPMEITRRFGALIRHCHVSELQLRPIGQQPADAHSIDHERMAAALHAIDYQGWVSLEMFATDKPDALDHALLTLARHYG
jgi:sugar phosphate isomerase/epimerase